MIRTIVTDDHTLVRAGLCRLLETCEDIEVVGDAGTGRETIELCRKLKPDVLLLDYSLPDMDGLDVTHHVLAEIPSIKVLILTMHDNEEYANRVIKAGAKGFLVKGVSPGELPDAIRKVADGKIHISTSIMEKMILRQNQRGDENPLLVLSDRELQIFVRLANGGGIGQISEELCLSPSTVGTYKKRIMDKLALNNLSELVQLAMEHKMIDK